MSNKDFIKLPNGKKIYLKNSYGKISIDEMPKSLKFRNIFTSFDTENVLLCKLNSGEINSIFSSLKDFAAQDGNNELSSAELESFIKQHCPEEEFGKVKANDMLEFLEVVQNKSEKSLKKPAAKIHVENSFEKFFPELSFLDLGMDNNIDTEKLGFDEIKKHFPDEKYEVVNDIPSPDDNEYPMEGETQRIINKKTGKEVVSFQKNGKKENYIKFLDEKTGEKFSINVNDNLIFVGTDIDFHDVNISRDMTIENGKVVDLRRDKELYIFDEGVLEKIYKPDSTTKFENGFLVEEKPHIRFQIESESEHIDISEKLIKVLDAENGNPDEFAKLIENSVKNDTIGSDMDDYFAKTGRELTEDIENSAIPDKLKKELLNSICYPYVDSKYYDAHKKVDSSRISNEYYRSEDEYSIEYNGPIINVFNKTTGKNSRINLKSLVKVDYRSKTALKRSLEAIQRLPGEVLENMAVEIRQIRGMKKEEQRSDVNNIKIGGFYIDDTITMPDLHPKTLIHELSHGIDEIYEGENTVYQSSKGKFKEIFDKCMQRLEDSGRKTFDDQNPMKGNWGVLFGGATNYATYDEAEAFAICVQILMGAENSNTKYVRKYMSELIEPAKEMYLETRKKPTEERRRL